MKFIEMFAGIGGFRYGLEQVGGFQSVWANDNDKYACEIYRKHYGEKEMHEGDIESVDPFSIPEFDLLTAGFPCQPFSLAGKRKGFQDTRGTLFYEIARVVEARKPKMLLLENVRGLLIDDSGRTFATILSVLGELGYGFCEWELLNSQNFRVPQHRERVFIIGHFGGECPKPIFPLGRGSCEDNEERSPYSYAIDASYYKGAGNKKQRTLVEITKNKPDAQRIYDVDGGLARTIKGLGGGQGGKTGLYAMPISTPDRATKDMNGRRIKNPNEPSFTLCGSEKHGIFTQEGNMRRIRRFTPLECERLQGFPDNWTEGISDTQRYKCCGNAVSTTVITAIGQRIKEVYGRS